MATNPTFPKQPQIEKLLNDMMEKLSKHFDITTPMKARASVAYWISKHKWNTILDALGSAGLLEEFNQMCQPILQPGWQPVAAPPPPQYFTCVANVQAKLVDWAVSQYITDVSANPEEFSSAASGDGEATVSSYWWFALAVATVGGLGYYAYSKTNERKPKGKKNPSGLKSTRDTPAVEKAVRKAANIRFGRAGKNERRDVFFEHGQWWISIDPDPEDPSGDNPGQYSVADWEPGLGDTGLDFERL